MSNSTPKNAQSGMTTRRSLFPSSYTMKENKKKKDLTTSFSPYARCVKIDSYKDMTEEEIRLVWWQKSDYDGFARVSRIISKAMLEGGSEIWLMPNTTSIPSTPTKAAATTTAAAPAATTDGLMASTKGPATPSTTPSTTSNPKSIENFHKTRDKWWHKFGHSRRGLEHVASIMEGRQRHGNVRLAIRSVIEEQERQRLKFQLHQHGGISCEGGSISSSSSDHPSRSSPSTFNNNLDVAKVRTVYLQYTHWARALARAAGESDADAVRTNFDETKRKPREYYLKSFFANKDGGAVSTTGATMSADWESKDLPHFMKTVLRINPNRYDDNTSSQLRLQRTKAIGDVTTTEKACNSRSSTLTVTCISTTMTTAADSATPLGFENAQKVANDSPSMKHSNGSQYIDPPEEKKCETEDEATEAVIVAHLQLESLSPTSLAKKAAGWGVDDAEAKNMSAVLTGMGTVS